MVLVHGAWAGPSSWDSVVRRLRDDGFRTATPTLGLTSLPGDVATVDAVLNQTPGKKILVGHSYGGAVISGASSGRSDVSALVFSAAFVPDAGDSLLSLGTGFTPSGVIPHLVWTGTPFAFGSLASIDPAFFPSSSRRTSQPPRRPHLPPPNAPSRSSPCSSPRQDRWAGTRFHRGIRFLE